MQLNPLKNGKHLDRRRLTVGELPKPLHGVRREARAYRRALERELLRVREISLADAHHIDTAAAATIQAGICRWLLRERLGSMSTTDILACTHAITKAKQARDAAVKALALDAPLPPPWIVLDAVVSEPSMMDDDAPGAAPSDPQDASVGDAGTTINTNGHDLSDK